MKYLFPIFLLVAVSIAGVLYFTSKPIGGIDEVSKDKLIEKYDKATEIKSQYSLDGASLIKTDIKNPELDAYKNEPKDEVKVTLGDKDATEFIPNIELKRWNEISFKIKPIGLDKIATKDKAVNFDADKIKYDTPKISFEMYDFTENEGGYKYIWYLNEKPLTNKVEFQIETSGLSFFYQPSLTQEYQNGYSEEFQKEIVVSETQVKDLEGNVLVERPENVVGSYAVYHSTKGGMNDAWGKDYKVGKAFHIYRPHLFDANGMEAWGNLHIENGIYSVEIPQDFLDKAVYPIKSNDDIGYTGVGLSNVTIATYYNHEATRRGRSVVCPSAGTLNYLKAYLKVAVSSSDYVDTTMFLNLENKVTDSHSEVAKIEILNLSFTNSYALKTFTTSSETLSATDYIINIVADGEDIYENTIINLAYDSSGGSEEIYAEALNNGYATLRDESPWTETDASSTTRNSFYATYTPSGGGGGAAVDNTFIQISDE